MASKFIVDTEPNSVGHCDNLLHLAEGIIFIGLRYPGGTRPYNEQEDIKEKRKLIPLLINAYDILKGNFPDDHDRFARLYYLARSVVKKNFNDEPGNTHVIVKAVGENLSLQIVAIAEEGRELSRSDDRYCLLGEFCKNPALGLSINLQDPDRGCSASICANCQEPVAFIDKICPNCERIFVGKPNQNPTKEQWAKTDTEQRDLCMILALKIMALSQIQN